jgi:membrane fusion protein, multidrug efflux system
MADADPHMKVEDTKRAGMASGWKRIALMVLIPLVILIGGVTYFLANDHYVSTDNAYVQQDKVSVSSEVGGMIVDVAVRENQRVSAGDILFRIDPAPFRIAVEQADASIAAAQVRVTTLQTELGTTGADILAARQNIAFAQTEVRREAELMRRGFTTRARLDAAEHALSEARARMANAEAEAARARAELATGAAAPGVNPGVLAGQVQRKKALLDLARTEVRAPVSGFVSQADRLQVGQMMVQGLPGATIVASQLSWVEANFKETDLTNMKVGQPADVELDAYPGIVFNGRVASIGAGTGSEFSVLPAQNANGNWVKVTQRVPVRISLDGPPARPLIAGLSAHVRVDTAR